MTSDLRARLADARLYLCTGSRRSQGDLPEFLDDVLGAGVDIVQLREKNLEAGEELGLLEVFAAACRRHGRLLAVNDGNLARARRLTRSSAPSPNRASETGASIPAATRDAASP